MNCKNIFAKYRLKQEHEVSKLGLLTGEYWIVKIVIPTLDKCLNKYAKYINKENWEASVKEWKRQTKKSFCVI